VSHKCHARGCTTPVKPEFLMCFRHWRQVPRKIQDAVWAAYRPGQCDDMRPSREWHRAADAAIGYVAKQQDLGVTRQEADAMVFFGFEP
jgi:hypothetical protein